MKTSKQFLLAVAFVLVVGLGAGVMAQAFRLPPEPVDPVVSVNAIEVTDGTTGWDGQKNETAFGYSFLGRTTGSLPGSFTLSMNCSPAIPTAGATSELTGGTWTLPVYMASLRGGASYAGSLYGTIAKGSMDYDKTGTSANIYIVLNVDGGTQTWDGVKGYATFVGTLSVDEKTQKTLLNGNLVFTTVSTIEIGK